MYCSSIVSRVRTLCISLRSTQSPRYQSLTLEGTLCLLSTPGWSLVPPGLYSTQEGQPSWFPLVPSDWGIWASPPETDQDSCPGWLPLVPLDSCLPQEGFFLVPLPLDLSASLPPVFFPLVFLCVFCVVCSVEPLCETIHRSEDVINDLPSP